MFNIIAGMLVVPIILFSADFYIRKATNNELNLPKIKAWIYVLAAMCGITVGSMYSSFVISFFLSVITGYMFYMGFTDICSKQLYNISYLAFAAGIVYLICTGVNLKRTDMVSIILYLVLIVGIWLIKGIALGDLKLLISIIPALIVACQYKNKSLIEILLGYLLVSFFLLLVLNVKKRNKRIAFAGYGATGFIVVILAISI